MRLQYLKKKSWQTFMSNLFQKPLAIKKHNSPGIKYSYIGVNYTYSLTNDLHIRTRKAIQSIETETGVFSDYWATYLHIDNT